GGTRVAPSALPTLAVQLYTIRDQIKQDPAAALARLASLGYTTVETAFWPEGMTVQQGARLLRDAGLTACSAHIELPVGDKRDAMLAAAKAYGCTRMIWHGWPEDARYSSLEGTRELARAYNEAHRFAKANGLQFGLHNHWWEYRNRVGGRYVFEVLLDEIDPGIFLEVDCYWVKVAGHVPAEVLRRLGDRAQMLHIKDGPARWSEKLAEDNPDPMTAVGEGTQDWAAIAAASAGHARYMVVEMDKVVGDPFDALARSRDFMVRRGIVAGR
ncbi:MAG TPA: sugar phosphate isomerase/epimerase, partial [Gemmatimonadaceae bacterium]|nr:sugar phosphate isomerase/epimerase [Gemmatimonadaceae bacterium]